MNKSYVLFSVFPILLVSVWKDSQQPVVPEDSQQQIVEKASEKPLSTEESNYYEISNYTENGLRAPQDMDEEWATWVGESKPVTWDQLKLDTTHRLSMVLTDFHSRAGNPYRVMHIHGLGFNGEADDTVTYFDRVIDGPEEQNTKANIVISHKIEPNGELYTWSEAERQLYKIGLKNNSFLIGDHIAEREPVVNTESSYFHEMHELDVDIVKSLLEGSGLTEAGLYSQELSWGGKNYEVQMNLRQTSVETTTVEVQFREVDSLITQKFALIYEPI